MNGQMMKIYLCGDPLLDAKEQQTSHVLPSLISEEKMGE